MHDYLFGSTLYLYYWKFEEEKISIIHDYHNFVQDGANIHRNPVFLDWLDVTFEGRVFAMGATTHGRRGREWAARSPDLTVADFALWPYLKEVYKHPAPPISGRAGGKDHVGDKSPEHDAWSDQKVPSSRKRTSCKLPSKEWGTFREIIYNSKFCPQFFWRKLFLSPDSA